MIPKERLEKLPKWAQSHIASLQSEVENLQKAHMLLFEFDWFTLGLHTPETTRVFTLDKEGANHIATIGAGAVLLVGHKKR